MKLDVAIRLIQNRWPNVTSSAPDRPIFLLAAGWRSGSTMLQRMLLKNCFVWGEPFGSSGLLDRLTQPFQRFSANWPKDEFFFGGLTDTSGLAEKWVANMYPSMEHLLNAHSTFWQTLLGEPARERGFDRWGFKEVRYGIEHAIYLKWVFPNARFVFLIRNPYDCWASYRRSNSRVLRFWPEELIMSPEQFGAHWLSIANGFSERSHEVNGFVLHYESLADPNGDLKPLQNYLEFDLDVLARKVVVGASPPGAVKPDEMSRLRELVAPLATRFGYHLNGTVNGPPL